MALYIKSNTQNTTIKKVIIYTDDGAERILEFCNAKTFYNSVNLYGETYQSETNYLSVEIASLKNAKSNQINACKRRGDIFTACESLYLPTSAYKSLTIEDKRKEYRKGCVSVFPVYHLTFDGELIQIKTKTLKSYFAKGDEPLEKDFHTEVKNLDEEVKESLDILAHYENEKLRQKKERYISLLAKKKSEGYKYLVYVHNSVPVTTDYLVLSGYVDHYEKSKEYQKTERLTEELKTINERWSIYDTEELLKRFTLTKKRSVKK